MILAVAGEAEGSAADMRDTGYFWWPVSTALPKPLYERQSIVALALPNANPDLCLEGLRQMIQAWAPPITAHRTAMSSAHQAHARKKTDCDLSLVGSAVRSREAQSGSTCGHRRPSRQGSLQKSLPPGCWPAHCLAKHYRPAGPSAHFCAVLASAPYSCFHGIVLLTSMYALLLRHATKLSRALQGQEALLSLLLTHTRPVCFEAYFAEQCGCVTLSLLQPAPQSILALGKTFKKCRRCDCCAHI